ncbi:hypothetical protein CLU79DRAFT_724877 [Phycomyces nitens]|nr:hypothetical protein CLU79DRAFT_724877 [Phycomyces nitens]
MISKLPHEVMLFITSPLSNKDIYSCLNVSREWRKTFEYFRWPHMIVKLSKLNSLKEDEKRHWIYNGYRSQYLQFYYENNSGDQFNDMDFHLKNIQDAQKYFPNIETLRFYFDAEFFPLPILANHGQAWSSLTSVSLVSFGEAGTYTYKDLDYLIDSLPNITAFEMTGTTIDPSSLYSVKSVHTSTNLKTLTIKCNDIPYLFYLYCKKRFPALCSITFDKIGPSSLLALPLSTSDDGFPEILTAETLNCFKDVNVRLANIGVENMFIWLL